MSTTITDDNDSSRHHHVHGYEEFCRFVDNLPTASADDTEAASASGDCGAARSSSSSSSSPLYILFCGSKDVETGINWCPWCTSAEPVVAEGMKLAPAGSQFLHVTVGERD